MGEAQLCLSSRLPCAYNLMLQGSPFGAFCSSLVSREQRKSLPSGLTAAQSGEKAESSWI